MSGFIVAKAYSARPESADELADRVTEASGVATKRSELTALAGPNHAIQLLAEIPTWGQLIAVYLSGKIAEGFISQFGAEAASKLTSKFKAPATPPLTTSIDNSINVNINSETFTRYVSKVAMENRDNQTLTMAVPIQTMGSRNLGLDLSEHLNGDVKHDSLIMLRGAVALVSLAQRMQRANLIPTSPQNRDCSVSVQLQEDGSFGGTYEYFAQQTPSVPPEVLKAAGYVEPGRYRLTLRFDAAGECVEDHLERVGDY